MQIKVGEEIIEAEDGLYDLGSWFSGEDGRYLVEKNNGKLYAHYFQGKSKEISDWDEDQESFVCKGSWIKAEIPANTTNTYLLSKLNMNSDIKKARIKINSEEERKILKGFFELQGWRSSDMLNWKGKFPFYGYDEDRGGMNAWPESTGNGICYASLNDFFLKNPIVKYKELRLNDKYTAHIYPDRVMVGDIKVSFDTIREIVSDKFSTKVLDNIVVRVPTQELFSIVNSLAQNPCVNNYWNTYKEESYILFEKGCSRFGYTSYPGFKDHPEVQIADLFIKKPHKVKIDDEYTAVIKGDQISIGCQDFSLKTVKELAALIPN